MYLVLIETSGNQRYIFETNKLRENVGASELTYRTGTKFVLDAVQEVGGPSLWDKSSKKLRNNLCNGDMNPPLQTDSSANVEVILAISGKALLLVQDEKSGKQIVHSVTTSALKEAPGLHVTGVISEFQINENDIHDAIIKLYERLGKVRCRIPGPAERFQRLPYISECETSGMPANRWAGDNVKLPPDEHGARSAVSIAKLRASEGWIERIKQVATKSKLPKATTQLEKEMSCEWLAVIHADGNGLGKVFLNFIDFVIMPDNATQKDRNRSYINQLRQFSLTLDECTENAFCHALETLQTCKINRGERKNKKEEFLPIVPILLGGDDFSAVCDGRQAMRFTYEFTLVSGIANVVSL